MSGRHVVLRSLGAGGMGSVYLAEDSWRGGRLVALKSAPLGDVASRKGLEREFGWLCRLRHPNVVAVHDFGRCESARIAWFTMAHADGLPLLEALAGRSFDEQASVVLQLCRAIDFVHSRGLVHADLKSENVIVRETADGSLHASLVDFGLAAEAEELQRRAAGSFSGTLSHAAPELVGGAGRPGPATDLYALGVLLFELHGGRRLFEEADPVALAEAHRKREPPSLGEACAGLGPGPRAQLQRLLAKVPEGRPRSALAVASAWAEESGAPVEELESLLAHVRAPRLIGQDEALSRALRLARSGADPRSSGSRALSVVGPQGSGKSRVLDEAAQAAQLEGVRVLRGRGGGSDDPMQGLGEPVREAARLAGETATPLLPELVKLSAALARETGVTPTEPLAPEDERLRLGAAVWEALLAAAVRPLLVIIDEADELSREAALLVAYLLRRQALAMSEGERAPVAFLVAGRGDAPVEVWREFEASGETAQTSLLDAHETGALLDALFPGLDGRDELVASFQGELGGSAALAELWAAKLVREGALTRRGRGWSVSLGHEALSSPPTDLADAVADQLSRLGGSLREVLADVAVLPDGSSAALVARLGGHDPARLERDLDELERLDLILAPSSESGRRVHAFSGLVRQAVAKNMGELRRERAGRLLDASEGLKDLEASERAQLAEIAERRDTAAQAWEDALAAARERGDEGRALTAARRLAGLTSGADRGRALRAAASAAVHLERFEDAEQLMESAEAEPCEDLADRLDRLDMAATVASRTGRLSEAEDLALERLEATPRDSTDRWSALSGLLTCRARDSSAQWEDLAEQLKDLSGDDAALLAEHQMHVAVAQLTRNHIPEAVEALSAALQGGLGRAREAAAFNNLGVAELRARNLKRSSRALGRAADIRREIGARVALSGTLVNLSLVDLELGRPAAASRRLRESLAIKREAGDRGGATLCLTNLAVAEYNRQELGEVLRLAEETRAESASVTAVRANAVVDMLDYDVRVQLGDRAGAATARDRLGSIEEDEGFRAHLAQLAIVRALEETGEGRRDRAIERLAALDAGGSLGDYDRLEVLLVQASLSLHAEETRRRPLEAASGDPELARAALRRIDELSADGSIMTPPLRLHLHLARAAAWDALGRRGRVRRELEQALACGGRSSERLLLGEVDAALGLEASRRANWPEAETHYESALRRVRAMARRLPAEHREGFLRQPRQAGLREALLSVREAQRRKEAEGSFFGPLRAAGAAGPARGAHAVGKQADGARQAKRLREVIEVTRDINALVPVGELLDRILDRVLGLMNAERGFIVLSGEGSEAEFAAARDRSGRRVERAEFAVSRSVLDEVMSTGKPVLSSDARADQRFVSKQSVLLLDLRSVLVAPLVAREEVIGALYVDNSQRAGAFGETELDLIALFAAQAAVAVENARLHETRVAKDLLDQELRIARGIQERLIPTTLPVIPGYRLAASMRPARELGGDYYDGLELPDGRVRVAIGDVSGKGIPAGLVMVMAHSILREVGFADEGLDRILERANAALESRIEDDKFMTLLLLEPEPGGRGLKLALAGHEPPLLWRSRDRRVEVLEAGGLALGMLPDLTGRLREDRVELEPGDLLCCYTDGVTECRAPDGVLYGRARLEAAIAVHAHRGAAGLRAALETELDAYRAGGERSDDLTLLVLATCDEEGDAR